MRLVPDQAGAIRRAEEGTFTFDGKAVTGRIGETLASALLRAGHLRLRDAPGDAAPRGMFCCMGLCQECVVLVSGGVVEACRLPVSSGLVVLSITARAR